MKTIICLILSAFQIFGLGGSFSIVNLEHFYSGVIFLNAYVDGKVKTYNKDSKEYDLILEEFKYVCDNAYETPAFGVSLNAETIKAMKNDIWLELVYDKTYEHNGMPFEKLLINLMVNVGGVNLIRAYDGKYDGRCYYLNFKNCNLDNLYLIITNNF